MSAHADLAPRACGNLTAPAPPAGTLENWAFAYLAATDLEAKFVLSEPPRATEKDGLCRSRIRPTRPAPLRLTSFGPKRPGREALRAPARRAELMHTFLHHELQAAELFCWAILAFPQAPEAFRHGLAHIARDEVRHMAMYRDYLARLGYAFGDFPVRDWFWERVPTVSTPAEFVATLGMGFEGGNLDHTRRFAAWFRAVGDEDAARIEDVIFEEEIPHVRFAVAWFRKWTGSCDFQSWARKLPAPLSPTLMRGRPIERAGRRRSGLPDQFVAELAAWEGR
jgi:uncharacterized ferritin-like protein (DUF455 family)